MTDLTRRHFAAGLVAAIAIPRSAPAQGRRETLRFGVFSLFAPQHLLLESSQPLLLHLDDQLLLAAPEDFPTAIRLTPGNRFEVVTKRAVHTVFNFTVTSTSNEAIPFTLSVPPSPQHGAIRRQYIATLELLSHPTGPALQPVVILEIETAVASIVQAESPAHAPRPYLRAQAIVSRSFLLAASAGHRGFDFCDTTHCQFLREAPSPDSPVALAVQDTRASRLTFAGQTLAAMYSRSCGGHTHTLAALSLPTSLYPYYEVPCDLCLRHPERWSRDLYPESLTERGRLAHNRIHGWSALPSSSFTRTSIGVEGVGIGHGLGLCQLGAAAMAANGSDHRQILAHYYPNTDTV